MLLIWIIIGGNRLTTMGTGTKFSFCMDKSDVTQDSISLCLNHTTSTALIFANSININPVGFPLAGCNILWTWWCGSFKSWYSIGRSEWAKGRSRGWDGGGTFKFHMCTNRSCRVRLTTPWTHLSSIQQRALGPKWMFCYCILCNSQALILQLQPPICLLIHSLNTLIQSTTFLHSSSLISSIPSSSPKIFPALPHSSKSWSTSSSS